MTRLVATGTVSFLFHRFADCQAPGNCQPVGYVFALVLADVAERLIMVPVERRPGQGPKSSQVERA
jgi:hypothetical protein